MRSQLAGGCTASARLGHGAMCALVRLCSIRAGNGKRCRIRWILQAFTHDLGPSPRYLQNNPYHLPTWPQVETARVQAFDIAQSEEEWYAAQEAAAAEKAAREAAEAEAQAAAEAAAAAEEARRAAEEAEARRREELERVSVGSAQGSLVNMCLRCVTCRPACFLERPLQGKKGSWHSKDRPHVCWPCWSWRNDAWHMPVG